MNLSKLFEMQKALDDHIIKEKHLEGQDLLPNTILALQVELGELANEWRGFKHWSNDQKPRRSHKVRLPGYTHETITNADGTAGLRRVYEYEDSRDPLLEEYVDCLHFILSIGNQLHVEDGIEIDSDYTTENPIKDFNDLFFEVARMFNQYDQSIAISKFDYEVLINFFGGIGERHLGFTWEEIEQAYFAKNAVNHQRQVNGY